MERYPIPEDHIFSSRSTDFAPAIMHMTDGKGVDIVVNSLSGEGLVQSWECTAPYGRFVEFGKKDILANAKLSMRQFLKHDYQRVACAALEAVMGLMDEDMLAPQDATHVYGVGEIEKAYRHMQSGKNFGKIVIESFRMRPHEGTSTKAHWLEIPLFRYMAQQRSSEGHRERHGQSVNLASSFEGQSHWLMQLSRLLKP
ncbi:hypothetical protein AbraIFM66951_010842 [Aspergillus brasiliensis]|uniref:Enoyl reductase (ER) domain-containing protein n=1 Tax=Aspergillus brasiliensis TaxID=319629 RepID=A0A9W6DK63_9EURO|nr:hypothetical protein AbraCBS73388_010071 [Aspergillus brasiliensis]GKZ47475.1 hypothetical protein AbraIFM66951_010842 [Aspergillus brasiliensis]